jgi:hypothetical protein
VAENTDPEFTERDIPAGGGLGRRSWLLLAACLPVAIACALIPFASLRALGATLGLAGAAAAVAFPVLPVLWHLLAERKRSPRVGGPGTALERLGLRSLGLGLIVLAVSLASLGPRQVGGGLAGLFGIARKRIEPAPAARPGAPVATVFRHELEDFIPADASLVVAMSGAAIMQQLLTSLGADTKKAVAAFQKCQVLTDRALVLVATRGAADRLVVVRAPGMTDQRNLYCMVGFLGSDRLGVKFTRDRAPVRFELQGLTSQTLAFEAVDDRTVIAGEGAWRDRSYRRLFPGGAGQAEGPLGPVLGRVDRGAGLWAAAVAGTEQGTWDLSLDARFGGNVLELRGSSVPPSGEANRADLRMQVPLAFAAALPEAALESGLRGVVTVVASAGARLPPPPAPPAGPAASRD